MTQFNEKPLIFKQGDNQCVGVLHRAENCLNQGLVIIVGGPQTRVGSHRQFVLLARALAKKGITVFRFDYRGMGDSDGIDGHFYQALPSVDIAVNLLKEQVPHLDNIALWGLCDAASLALTYLSVKPNSINKVVLLNPWVRQEHSKAKAVLKHYYINKLLSKNFWLSLLKGKLNFKSSTLDLASNLRAALKKKKMVTVEQTSSTEVSWPYLSDENYIAIMKNGLNKFTGELFIILSSEDLTAQEFVGLVNEDIQWQQLMKNNCNQQWEVKGANHTFSSQLHRQKVEQLTIEALLS